MQVPNACMTGGKRPMECLNVDSVVSRAARCLRPQNRVVAARCIPNAKLLDARLYLDPEGARESSQSAVVTREARLVNPVNLFKLTFDTRRG